MKKVLMYTDGSCLKNPGPGGFGVVLKYNEHSKELCAGFPRTTNNAMELLGVINGLACLKEPCDVEVTTDSKYVKDGIESWLQAWKKNNWKTKENKQVKNRELWEMLDEQLCRHNVTMHWIKGHSGHTENERCDTMARECAARQQSAEELERVRY
ncbi:MAG: ribonuclease HI [Succinivibrionaceae bacterium]|nr:ribonuclease HI [Succinivibrionaceae bacterium]